MAINRRIFNQGMLLSAALWPFMLRSKKVYGAEKRSIPRFIFITSIGVDYKDWLPKSRSGEPVEFGEVSYSVGLKSILDKIILIGNLSGNHPGENHATTQDTTCLGLADKQRTSLETYMAEKLAVNTPFKTILLGANARDNSRFYKNGVQQPVIDSPLEAYRLAFGQQKSTTMAFPRKGILDINVQQIKKLQSTLGGAEKVKLQQHLSNIETLEKRILNQSTCRPAGMPDLKGKDPTHQSNTALMGQLQLELAPYFLLCGVTNMIGFQWGTTITQTIEYKNEGVPERYAIALGNQHGEVHSYPYGQSKVLAAEYFLSQTFAQLIKTLSTLDDPLFPGEKMIDNTIVYWTRDIGNGPMHSQESVPQVIAGGARFFKYMPQGHFVDYKQSQGSTRRVMITIANAMNAEPNQFGVRDGQPNTADFHHKNGGNPVNTKFLEEIMR